MNLLREGLDLPEVSFIGILDAEKIGFLRSTSALLQIIGRAARNVNGKVIMYSHNKRQSSAMEEAIGETLRRREIQNLYNIEHGITPQTIISSVKEIGLKGKRVDTDLEELPSEKIDATIRRYELEMDVAASNLDFELAAEIRDKLVDLRRKRKNTK